MEVFRSPIFRDFNRTQIRAASKDSPNGGGSGCGNVTGYLDSWGTMTLPGAFEETAPSLLKEGFLCDGHGRATNGYTEKSNLGYFTKVSEDEEGLQLEWDYHSKPHSQDARTTLEERLAADKTSGLSIGFFVGNGRTQPIGWEYDPDVDPPEGIDYICVLAKHIEEVLIMASKPEFLKANLERAKDSYCIYLLLRVHVFEVSQTLIPSNEVSLIAEVRDSNKLKPKNNMATTRAKPEKDDDEPNQDDLMQAVHRTVRAMKNEHREHDRAIRDHLSTLAGCLEKLAGKPDPEEEDEEEPEEKPKKGKGEEEKKSRAQKLFESGGKK